MEGLWAVKQICKELAVANPESFFLLDTEWSNVENLIKILQRPKLETISMQNNEITLSEFFIKWKSLKEFFSTNSTPFSQELYLAMEKREPKLLTHPVMFASLFLDPRYQIVLTSAQRTIAKEHLKNLWFRINNTEANLNADCNNEMTGNEDANSERCDTHDDFVDTFLLRMDQLNANTAVSTHVSEESKIQKILDEFDHVPRIDRTENILKYWQQNQHLRPELYRLSGILFSVPISQASVERCFSTLSFVVNKYRTSLKEETLENILLVKLNYDVLNKNEI